MSRIRLKEEMLRDSKELSSPKVMTRRLRNRLLSIRRISPRSADRLVMSFLDSLAERMTMNQ